MRSKRNIVMVLAIVAAAGGAACWLALSTAGRELLASVAPGASRHRDRDHGEAEHAEPEPGDHDDGEARHAEPEDDGHGHGEAEHAEGKPDDHDHAEAGHAEPEPDDHDHGADGHEEGHSAGRLTPEQMRKLGIVQATAGPGRLQRRIRLPGEIVLNADRAAHVVPPVGGVVRKVFVKVGDLVRKNDPMAVLESTALGEAKIQFLAGLAELQCCGIELTRAKAIQESTVKLLELLGRSPALEELHAASFTGLGEGHAKLVSAYAELALSRKAYEREKKLVSQSVGSKGDLQAAESAYQKAHAVYLATRDGTAFQTKRSLLEAERTRRNTEVALLAAERKLHVLGLGPQEVAELRTLAGSGRKALPAEKCTDPNCKDCQSEAKKPSPPRRQRPEELALYTVRAPFAGTVIEKHLTLGEKVSDDSDVFTVADMGSVWVDLSVYQKDLLLVRKGQTVHLSAGKGIPVARGRISFVSPIVNQKTRTCLARVVLPNPQGVYRPGLFVTAEVELGSVEVPVLVPRAAVQQIEGKAFVFVPAGGELVARAVKRGRSCGAAVEILSGLEPGRRYVCRGAFQLKAKIVTSGLGAHAGHGH